jgi:hypothetical protein
MKVGQIKYNTVTKCNCVVENCDNYEAKGFVWVYLPLYKITRPEFIKNLK